MLQSCKARHIAVKPGATDAAEVKAKHIAVKPGATDAAKL